MWPNLSWGPMGTDAIFGYTNRWAQACYKQIIFQSYQSISLSDISTKNGGTVSGIKLASSNIWFSNIQQISHWCLWCGNGSIWCIDPISKIMQDCAQGVKRSVQLNYSKSKINGYDVELAMWIIYIFLNTLQMFHIKSQERFFNNILSWRLLMWNICSGSVEFVKIKTRVDQKTVGHFTKICSIHKQLTFITIINHHVCKFKLS